MFATRVRVTLLVVLAGCSGLLAGCGHGRAAVKDEAAPAAFGGLPVVKIVVAEDQQRVDVLFDDQPFTSYRWEPSLKKPVLFPVRTAGGAVVTRGWPVEPRPEEAHDHPHHVGFWLSYGDVAGVDFWGNSSAVKPESAAKKGTIVHRGIRSVESGVRGHGALAVTTEWVLPDGKAALREDTTFAFSGAPGRRVIDRLGTLTAVAGAVPLPDNKEGALGLRVARALEHPSGKNPGATGLYRSSEGVEGDKVWGTRGRWLMLTGSLDTEPVTIVIFDHPGNPGFPTHWHARPYGLFAANPLGAKDLSGGKEVLNYTLPAGGTARLAYRLLILSRRATPEEIEGEYRTFLSQVP
jgi:hypothetical protein